MNRNKVHREHARPKVSQILCMYLTYPYGKEPIESVWKGKAKPGEWSNPLSITFK